MLAHRRIFMKLFWKIQFCFLNTKIRQNSIGIQFYNTDIIILTIRLLEKCEERLSSELGRNRPKGGDRSPEILTPSQKGRLKTLQTQTDKPRILRIEDTRNLWSKVDIIDSFIHFPIFQCLSLDLVYQNIPA